MAQDYQFDSREDNLVLPYNRIEKELSEEPRLVAGLNMYSTVGGKLSKRPGTLAETGSTLNGRIDRLWIYETLESPPVIYLMASVKVGSVWTMYYLRLDAGSPMWTSVGSLRSVNSSTRAHEAVAARGLFFIKGFPSVGSGEKLGTVTFVGTAGAPYLTYWGALPPSTPARISGVVHKVSTALVSTAVQVVLNSISGLPVSFPFNIQIEYELIRVDSLSSGTTYNITRAQSGTIALDHAVGILVIYRDWTASSHPVGVNFGWRYSYAYKLRSGHITNRAHFETNPDSLPSSTGPFVNLIPKITVQGIADTTNIPTIVILRSTDGGGILYVLKEITNTGAGSITVYDTDLVSDAGSLDPLPDDLLQDNDFGPGLTLNSPPPTVNAPLIVGTDTPSTMVTPIAYFSSRVWFAIGNVLYYSGQEEITIGIPEECWPSGVKGNYFLFKSQITNLNTVNNKLYVATIQETYEISGTNKETFNPKPILSDIGHPYGHPRAMCSFRNSIAWVTHDFRVAVTDGSNLKVISDPLFTDIISAVNAGGELSLIYYSELEKEWLILQSTNVTTMSATRQWVYDLKLSEKYNKDYWNPPWDLPATALVSGRIRESNSQRRVVFFVWDGTSSSQIVRLDSTGTTATDALPAGSSSIHIMFNTNLYKSPSGNHLNALRQPSTLPVVDHFLLERTAFTTSIDEDMYIYYFTDDTFTNPKPGPPEEFITRTDLPKGYKVSIYPINEVAYRFALKGEITASWYPFELQTFTITWKPDKGTGVS